MVTAKPFVKWAGGKRSLLAQLDDLLPENFKEQQNVTYVEPFVGGGAMLFHMLDNYRNIKRAVINDVNTDLIHCYQFIKNKPYELIERLDCIERNFKKYGPEKYEELYYYYREQFNDTIIQKDERAVLFILLNHTCFNGLFRVNSNGKFNVPFGKYSNIYLYDEKVILKDHRLLNSIDLVIRAPGDYRMVERNLRRYVNAFVYFDPPYRPLSETSSFRAYSNSPFGDIQQVELKEFCDKLSERGCQIMLSNSDSKTEDGNSYFEKLYEGYTFRRLYAPRYISASSEKRRKYAEVLIRNY